MGLHSSFCAAVVCFFVALLFLSGTAMGDLDAFGEGCEYVEAGPPGPKGNRLLVVGVGEPHLQRSGDALVVRNGPPGCGRTRVDSIDRVVIKAEGSSVSVDESGGRFGPGATPERGGSEIEIYVRAAEFFSLHRGPRDSVTRIEMGANDTVAFNLNPAADGPRRDRDVSVSLSKDELRRIKVFAEEGDDRIDARRLTGIPDNHIGFPFIRLHGGSGPDAILGGPEAEEFFDGPGSDLIRGAGGEDQVELGTGSDTIYGGFGGDGLVYTSPLGAAGGRRDAADRLFAGPGADVIQDDDGYPDVIRCGPGSDLLDAHGRDRGRDCEKVRHGRGDLI